MVTLKRKITLRRKGEAADFTLSGKLKVKLLLERKYLEFKGENT